MSTALALLRRIPIAGWVIIALLAALGAQSFRLHRSQEQKRKAGIELENAKARVDTLKTIEHLSAKDSSALGLGDSMQVLTQLVVQGRQQRDALDRTLHQERAAKLDLTVKIAELRRDSLKSVGNVVVDANDVRSARFSLYQAPFTLAAIARLPAVGQGRLDSLSIRTDTARLSVRLGCGPANVAGVRSAQMAIVASDWLKISAPAIEQAPEVCGNGPKSSQPGAPWWKPSVVAGYSLIAARDSTGKLRAMHGPSLTLGWKIW